jgi:hypothetical protein
VANHEKSRIFEMQPMPAIVSALGNLALKLFGIKK